MEYSKLNEVIYSFMAQPSNSSEEDVTGPLLNEGEPEHLLQYL